LFTPRSADQDQFTAETQAFRRELLAHCYRMVGSAYDAAIRDRVRPSSMPAPGFAARSR
jgi:hypothetical protein